MTRRLAAVMSWCLVTMVGACSATNDISRDEASGQEPGSTCAPEHLTQACSCSGGLHGRQTCMSREWTACECRAATSAAAGSGSAGSAGTGANANANANANGNGEPVAFTGTDPAGNRSGARFDWQRTVPTGGSCEAGHYEGTFTGIYGPSIIVVADLKVIPVFPIDLPDSPGLAFDLTREGMGEIFTVSNGKMNGNALGAFPFTADIVGKLDCETMKFDAMLVNGSYFIGPLEYRFEGPIVADYDKQTHTLVNGTWVVEEPDYPGAGGSGDWTVQWIHN